jgi:predicted transcriptional regulator
VQRKAAERLAELRDDAMGLLALQIRRTVECITSNHPQLVGYVEPAVAARAVKDLSELVETLEGRASSRVAVTVEAIDAEIARLEAELESDEEGEEGAPPGAPGPARATGDVGGPET